MQVKRYPLKNNSPLVIIRLPNAGSLTIMAIVRAGPMFDPVSKSGISHFVEHMLFRGSKNFPTNKLLATSIEKYGATASAFSYHDYNKFWIRAPHGTFENVSDNLIDRICNPILRIGDVENEKKIVIEELKMVESNPEKLIWELWNTNVWQNSPLGRNYFGSEDSIKNFSRKDVVEFFKKHYLANNTTFLVSGDVDEETVLSFFNRKLTDYSRKGNQAIHEIDIKRALPIKLFNYKTPIVTASFGFLTTPLFHEHTHALDLLAALLGNGFGSTLEEKIAEKGLVYSIECYSIHMSITGSFMILFTTQLKNLNKVLSIIEEEIVNIKSGKISSEQFLRAQTLTTGNVMLTSETSFDLVDWFAYQELVNSNRVLIPAEKVRFLRKTTKEELINVTKRYFTKDNWYLSLIGGVEENKIKSDFHF